MSGQCQKVLLVSLTLCSLLFSLGLPAQTTAFLDEPTLVKERHELQNQQASPPVQQAWARLKRQADSALAQPLMSVTDKGMLPPSGSKHDYLSLSAYWWPDASHPDGPWIRRDGEVNPASKNAQSDGLRLAEFTSRVQALTLAWYFSGDRQYADKAIALLRHWFLQPASLMNPNLNFAQGVPGVAAGRGSGVLDGRYFASRIVDSLLLLKAAPGWTTQDQQGMQQWLSAYLDWLQHSKPGRHEAKAANNHGNWYNVQVAGLAWYLDRPDLLREQVAQAKARMHQQIKPNGTQPLELARTRSFHYSYFNLQALVLLAVLAEKSGAEDLWQAEGEGRPGILTALDFMAPYADSTKAWPYKSLDRRSERLVPLLMQADNSLHSSRYQAYRRFSQASLSGE